MREETLWFSKDLAHKKCVTVDVEEREFSRSHFTLGVGCQSIKQTRRNVMRIKSVTNKGNCTNIIKLRRMRIEQTKKYIEVSLRWLYLRYASAIVELEHDGIIDYTML